MEDTVESPLGNDPIPPTMGGGSNLMMVGLSMSCLHGLTENSPRRITRRLGNMLKHSNKVVRQMNMNESKVAGSMEREAREVAT